MRLVYAATVIVSACLLFLVQPLIAKIIFPWFGGTSAVWIAALVFFQLCVLCGYAYAHWLINHVPPRRQAWLHAALLMIACATMPILPADTWRPSGDVDPTQRILLLLGATVGLPALLLSSTSPLLQSWYLRLRGHEIPYWMFALSNLGSLIALLSFPLLLEPAFAADTLAWAWSALFLVFAALCLYVAWLARRVDVPIHIKEPGMAAPPGRVQMSLWVLFAACACGFLLAISTQLSTNVAPIPLLWVLPLALYLLSFVLCFGNRRLYSRTAFFPWLVAALGCTAWLYTHSESYQHLNYVVPLYLACLFVICMACHGEVAHRAPAPRYLTRFYLLIALGGALGGLGVGVFAPMAFDSYLELPLLLIVTAALMLLLQWRRKGSVRTLWLVRIVMVCGVVVLTGSLAIAETRGRQQNVLVDRSFYGVLRVRDYVDQRLARRSLINGTISHGYEFLSKSHRGVVGSYYSASSAVAKTLAASRTSAPLRFGVIGLGAGVLTSYARSGDYLRWYEIDPHVVAIAEKYFSFLPGGRQRGADVKVLLGDARLTLERQEPQRFDVLVVDAFSSDAIPTHLLTHEAMQVYFKHLQPDGVLVVHISNRYLDLTPVCLRAAEHVGRDAYLIRSPMDEISNASDWVLITSNRRLLEHAAFENTQVQAIHASPSFQGWSDRYSSVWPVLSLGRKAVGAH